MQDIAPDLLKKILELFAEKTERDPTIAEILEHIDAGTATAEDVQRFAIALGGHESDALLDVLTPDVLPDGKMYYNIAERTVRPTIEQSHELFSEAAAQIQKQLNENAGIGLRAVTPKLDEDRVRGIIDKISDAPLFEDVRWVLNEPIRVLVQSFADEFVKANAEFQADTGLSPTITRTVAGGCCQWCRALAGKYTYQNDVPDDVYRRHAYCRCLVTYDPGDGSKRVQNVHSKKWATREEIEERQETGIRQRGEGIIAQRIKDGEYSTKLSRQQYLKHVPGTPQQRQYEESSRFPPSRLLISEQEAQTLIDRYAGTGAPGITKNGTVRNVEYVSTDHVIGQYNNLSGWHDTRRFAIHYEKNGAHIVPVKE